MNLHSKQISSPTANAMAKHPCNMGANKIEELVFDSDSEVQLASDSDTDFVRDFS
jgi:hypothetical protein